MARERAWRKVTVYIAAALALVLGALLLVALSYLWTEYRWYASVERVDVWLTQFLSAVGVWAVFTATGTALLYATARKAGRITGRGRRFNRMTLPVSLLIAGLAALNVAQSWMTFRLALVQAPFGITDPQFGRDVGFFVFTLPALELANDWFTGLVFLALMVVFGVVAILIKEGLAETVRTIAWDLKALVWTLLGTLMLSVSLNFWIETWRLVYTARDQLVGASYTDVHAQLPANWIMVVLSLGLAVFLFVTAKTRSWWPSVVAFGTWAVAGIVLVSAWPALVQNYVVAPNEQTLEAPYIQRNIDMTRAGFGLEDVDTVEYPAAESLGATASATAARTLRNTRIWEPSSVGQAFAQLQTIRPYYRLSKIQTDRYRVNGDLEQVLVSAREIDTTGLPATAQTWVNQHLVYTHGFGLAIASASETTPRGFPRILVGDVPPRVAAEVATGSPELVAEQPRIYFGPATTDYAIVNTAIDEFDYPMGDSNATYRHEAADGVRFGSVLDRVLWAIRLGSDQILFSEYLKPESRILLYRDVASRVSRIAPWLQYDKDPYPAIVDGRIVWIVDGYTSSDHFPYSQPLKDGTNYLRESVKATVDAYTGEVRFYAIGEDPIRDAWVKIFPGVVKPQREVPASLANHFRYPVRLFSAQSGVYRTYHMTDPTVFYNKEDQWHFVGEKTGKPIEPSYLLLDPPGSAQGTGLQLMRPFSPTSRDNMIGIMSAASEPQEYGDLTVYALPKERVVLGPQQVIARIEQDPTISPQLSLWDQRGSKVIFGEMVVLPVQDTIVYVQPVFLQAEKSAITELAAVIVVAGDEVAMGDTLADALARALGGGGLTASGDGRLDALLDAVLTARESGDDAAYSAAIERLRSALATTGAQAEGASGQ